MRRLRRAGRWTRNVIVRSAAVYAATLAITALPARAQSLPECSSTNPDVHFDIIGDDLIITAPDGSTITCSTFDIGFDNLVRFIQGGVNARVLARITVSWPRFLSAMHSRRSARKRL